MGVPQFDPSTGALPRGRFPCQLEDVHAEFVAAPWASVSATRGEIWDGFLKTIGLYRAIDPGLPEAVWIGGSFVTNKVDPDDIDVTFLLREDRYEALSNKKQHRVDRISARERGGAVSRLRAKLGLRVDCFHFVCVVAPWPWAADMSVDEATYFRTRGLWDDWWQRILGGPKGSPASPTDALPRRGFLEVPL